MKKLTVASTYKGYTIYLKNDWFVFVAEEMIDGEGQVYAENCETAAEVRKRIDEHILRKAKQKKISLRVIQGDGKASNIVGIHARNYAVMLEPKTRDNSLDWMERVSSRQLFVDVPWVVKALRELLTMQRRQRDLTEALSLVSIDTSALDGQGKRVYSGRYDNVALDLPKAIECKQKEHAEKTKEAEKIGTVEAAVEIVKKERERREKEREAEDRKYERRSGR